MPAHLLLMLFATLALLVTPVGATKAFAGEASSGWQAAAAKSTVACSPDAPCGLVALEDVGPALAESIADGPDAEAPPLLRHGFGRAAIIAKTILPPSVIIPLESRRLAAPRAPPAVA